MASANPAMAAAYERAFDIRGETVMLTRISGTAPRAVEFSAQCRAVVTDASPDGQSVARTGYGAGQPGSISQTSREVLLLVADLEAARFPLPVRKNDKLTLADGTRLFVTEADSHKRAIAGCVELKCSGVP